MLRISGVEVVMCFFFESECIRTIFEDEKARACAGIVPSESLKKSWF